MSVDGEANALALMELPTMLEITGMDVTRLLALEEPLVNVTNAQDLGLDKKFTVPRIFWKITSLQEDGEENACVQTAVSTKWVTTTTHADLSHALAEPK